MTLPDNGYDDYMRHLSAEGVAYQGVDLAGSASPAPTDAPLPDKKTTERLKAQIIHEFQASEAARRTHMERVTAAWAAHDMTPYDPDQLILPEMESVRVPLTLSRVNAAHSSMYGALAITPFPKAEVTEGADGTLALHADAAIGEELDRGAFENELDIALRGSLVGTIGFLKTLPIVDEDEGRNRLDVEAVDIREMFLSPHEVRNIDQCNMLAHRWKTDTWGWALDQALAGVFDKDAVMSIRTATASTQITDGGGTERAAIGLENTRSYGPDESQQLDIVEAYIRFRPTPDSRREWWRVYLEYTSKTVLRAEPWDDGQPFSPIRHERGQTTMYAPSFANRLQDMQWASDMLLSASIEADRMGVAPTWKVSVMSPAMEFLKRRQVDTGGAVRPLPGDVIPTRGENDLMPMYHQPTPPQIDARMNRIEQNANLASISVTPMQTYRSATEHRYAQASVSGKEQQMLKVLRADLSRFLEYYKRLYWKYCAQPVTPDGETRQVIHGTQAYTTTAQQWAALRLTPRGMTTAADQMLTMQASQEALALVMQVMPQKPMMMQAGMWEFAWNALRARLDALGISDYQNYIGMNPVQDPNLTELDPITAQKQQQAAMMLMQMQAGQMPQPGQQGGPGALPGVQGEQVRGTDGAPTVPPGGAAMGGLN